MFNNRKIIKELKARCARLCKALDAATNVGVYPRAVVGGSDPYEKRTEYMEGWNDACKAQIEAVIRVELEDEDWIDEDNSILPSNIDGQLLK